MSWPGLDAALNELDMLSTITTSRKEYLREKLERQRHHHPQAGIISGSPPVRSVERPLQPSQAWNMPGTTGSIEGGVGWGWSPGPADNEDNENKFRFDSSSRLKAVPSRIGMIGTGLNLLHMNPSLIPSSIGLDLDLSDGAHRRSCPARLAQLSAATHRQHHLKPYNIPWRREERVRTKSENADSEPQNSETSEIPVREAATELLPPTTPLFRSRSLEDVRSPPADLEELDEMSLEIQRLHVNE